MEDLSDAAAEQIPPIPPSLARRQGRLTTLLVPSAPTTAKAALVGDPEENRHSLTLLGMTISYAIDCWKSATLPRSSRSTLS